MIFWPLVLLACVVILPLCLVFLLKVLVCSVFVFCFDAIARSHRMPNQLYNACGSCALACFGELATPVPLLVLESLRPLHPCTVWSPLLAALPLLAMLAAFGELAAPVPMPTMLAASVPLHGLESLRPLFPCLQCLRPLCPCMF